MFEIYLKQKNLELEVESIIEDFCLKGFSDVETFINNNLDFLNLERNITNCKLVLVVLNKIYDFYKDKKIKNRNLTVYRLFLLKIKIARIHSNYV